MYGKGEKKGKRGGGCGKDMVGGDTTAIVKKFLNSVANGFFFGGGLQGELVVAECNDFYVVLSLPIKIIF